VNWLQDPNGNWLARYVFHERTTGVQHHRRPAGRYVGDQSVRLLCRTGRDEFPLCLSERVRRKSLRRIFPRKRRGPLLAAYVQSISREPKNMIDFMVELNQRLQRDIKYLVRLDPGVQTPEQHSRLDRALAATPHGCWCMSCGISALASRFVSGLPDPACAGSQGA